MQAKSGAARIALETGCPVIPVGQWGAQGLLPPYSAKLRLVPRQRIQMKAGDPVDLSDLLTKPRSTATINEATARIMAAIVALVAELRGEVAPPELFDSRKAGIREIGNPGRQDEA
jgi:1-acyl-sn-glycerol-3-phosphate acyltransferase